MGNTPSNFSMSPYARQRFNINMTIFKALFAVALFVALTPGILLTIPKG